MGTIIIHNLSTLDDTAALIRVGFYMNGDQEEAQQGGLIVRDDTSVNDDAKNKKRYTVFEK